ncbi:hypothetical protein PENTCL1PPCAC_5593, partial [Pristionchus entomophagus]
LKLASWKKLKCCRKLTSDYCVTPSDELDKDDFVKKLNVAYYYRAKVEALMIEDMKCAIICLDHIDTRAKEQLNVPAASVPPVNAAPNSTFKRPLAEGASSSLASCVFCGSMHAIGVDMEIHVRSLHAEECKRYDQRQSNYRQSPFGTKSNLTHRTVMETWLEKYTPCRFRYCDYRSTIKSQLLEHEENFHRKYIFTNYIINNGLHCPLCPKVFRFLNEISEHMTDSHLWILAREERIFECGSCLFTAARFYQMIAHRTNKCSPGLRFVKEAVERANNEQINHSGNKGTGGEKRARV